MTTTRVSVRLSFGAPRALPFMLWLMITLAGCAGQPAGDAGREEAQIAEVARALEAQYGLVDDARLVDYVGAVGSRLAAQTEQRSLRYRFHVIDMAAPNAFALPNGNIYVSRGLPVLINSEDQLAGILAHEVAHVDKRHSQRSRQAARVAAPVRLGTGIAGAARGIVAPRAGAAISRLGAAASEAVLAPYGRDQEREADEVGQALVARAGL